MPLRAKTKFLTFTTYENCDPYVYTRMEWFNATKAFDAGADLFECVYLLLNEELADWVWHWEYTKDEARANHDTALDAVLP
jgi:hypothetical protein